ncbi:MAG: hypothetical protein K2O14_03800, partial [Oscillospiraceae bacterium]|nr:hypothetical protein [Oscillospiraceae bacterium]
MDNNRLKFGVSANFEDCFEVIRVNAETGKCDFLKRCAEHTLGEPTIGEYFDVLRKTGWIFPGDHETYSDFFELSHVNERLKSGRLILNSIRIKPADSYLWTDFELVRPKSCPQYIFICIKDLKRKSRPALNGFRLLMRTDMSGKTVYPITVPLCEFVDFHESLEYYVGTFGLDFPSALETTRRVSRSADGFTVELSADPEGLTAAVYEDGTVSEERLGEIFDHCRRLDPKTGLYTEYYVRENAGKSEGEHIGAMLIAAEGVSYDKAFVILKRDYADFVFARGRGQLAVVFTDSENRLRYEFGSLCRRLLDTGGDFEIYTALSARPASAEEVLAYAENSRPQTPGDFRWSAAGEACRNT